MIVSFAACSRDKGNYNYNPINEIGINSLDSAYSVITGVHTLHIEPKITTTEQMADPGRLLYYWIVVKGTTVVDTVGKEAILDYRVTLPPGSYAIVLRIVDKQTTVAWKKTAALTVGTLYSKGILLMGTDEAGNAEAQMISMVKDTVMVPNILSQSGLPPLKDPISLFHTGGTSSATDMRVWAITKSGSYFLDRQSMKGTTDNNFGSILYTTENTDKSKIIPVLVIPQIKALAGSASSAYTRAVLSSEGNIYTTHTFLTAGDYYTSPINRVAADFDKLIKAAPYLFYAINSMSGSVWYDIENQRFMNFASYGTGTSSTILTDAASTDLFPWDQKATGRQLIYGENTRNSDGGSTNGNSFAILRNNNNESFIYKFYASGSAPAKRGAYKILPIAIDFHKASLYAFSSKRSVVFYTVGAKLYAYDYNPGLEKFYEFPQISADQITMLKFDTQMDPVTTNSLYIATYSAATKGTLTRYNVGTNPNTVDITPVDKASWSGLAKIKDMNWRPFN